MPVPHHERRADRPAPVHAALVLYRSRVILAGPTVVLFHPGALPAPSARIGVLPRADMDNYARRCGVCQSRRRNVSCDLGHTKRRTYVHRGLTWANAVDGLSARGWGEWVRKGVKALSVAHRASQGHPSWSVSALPSMLPAPSLSTSRQAGDRWPRRGLDPRVETVYLWYGSSIPTYVTRWGAGGPGIPDSGPPGGGLGGTSAYPGGTGNDNHVHVTSLDPGGF